MLRNVFIIIFSAAIITTSCCEKPKQKITVAISKEKSQSSTTKYSKWLLNNDSTINLETMYPMGIDSAISTLINCDGLLLTGGEDVFPGNYGKIDDTSRCGIFDLYRDSLEFALIEKAIEMGIPIFGVCRGEQILNISQGGTLYIDIPTDFDTTVSHRNEDWSRCYHPVWLVEGTDIWKACGTLSNRDIVTSHHQGIEVLGNNLRIAAYSADSLPEAIEWSQGTSHPFLMAVQWHPEAMDSHHDLSKPLASEFIEACYTYNSIAK